MPHIQYITYHILSFPPSISTISREQAATEERAAHLREKEQQHAAEIREIEVRKLKLIDHSYVLVLDSITNLLIFLFFYFMTVIFPTLIFFNFYSILFTTFDNFRVRRNRWKSEHDTI